MPDFNILSKGEEKLYRSISPMKNSIDYPIVKVRDTLNSDYLQ